MARRDTSFNKLTVKDPISNSDIQWFYRLPTSEERLALKSKVVTKEDGKIKISDDYDAILTETAFGLITGFRIGDFERKVGDDQYQAFSFNPADENYYPEWREWLRNNAMDLVGPLAKRIFVDKPAGVTEDAEK